MNAVLDYINSNIVIGVNIAKITIIVELKIWHLWIHRMVYNSAHHKGYAIIDPLNSFECCNDALYSFLSRDHIINIVMIDFETNQKN